MFVLGFSFGRQRAVICLESFPTNISLCKNFIVNSPALMETRQSLDKMPVNIKRRKKLLHLHTQDVDSE